LFLSNPSRRVIGVALASLLAATFIVSVWALVALVAFVAEATVYVVLLLLFALFVGAAPLKREAG
jgi:hypothetical protein